MRVVGIRELKARLSAYLREVGRGEVFLVTDRDRVVAELRPPAVQASESSDPEDAALRALADAGEITLPERTTEDWSWQPRGIGLPKGTALRILDELREDRIGS